MVNFDDDTTYSTRMTPSTTWFANALGYLIGAGSLLLYTPMVIRLYRQRKAEETTLSTWMMKVASYLCTDLYSLWKAYPLSTYIDTLIITLESSIVLIMVVIYQHRTREFGVWLFVVGLIVGSAYLYFGAPAKVLALGQLSSAGLNSGALVPQFWLNYRLRTKGDYSPITASLASIGCAVRIWTVQELAHSDPILLFSFGIAWALNTALLLQIVYYGVCVEGLTVAQVFAADVSDPVPTELLASTVSLPLVSPNSGAAAYSMMPHSSGFDDNSSSSSSEDSMTAHTTPIPSRFATPETASIPLPSSNFELTPRHRL